MPNLVITNACNLGCPFCFATEYRATPGPCVSMMTLAELGLLLDYQGDGQVRFCGGEPTLHPEFLSMVHLCRVQRGLKVLVMSNGLWPDVVRHHVASLPSPALRGMTYLINVLEPGLYSEEQQGSLDATLSVLPPRAVTLGFTIYKPSFDPTHVLDLATRHGVDHLRYSIAAPNITDPATWTLDPARDFRGLAELVYHFVKEARRRGLHVQSDCGYLPPCMFTTHQREVLVKRGGTRLRFSCDGPVDIGPGGEAWRCYGLYSVVRAHTGEFSTARQLAADLERRTRWFKDRFLFDHCRACDWLECGECGGGCHAFRVAQSLRKKAQARGLSSLEDAVMMTVVPRLVPNRLHLWNRGEAGDWMVSQHGEWESLRTSAVEDGVLRASDGVRSMADIVTHLQRGMPGVGVAGVARTLRKLFELGVVELDPHVECEPDGTTRPS